MAAAMAQIRASRVGLSIIKCCLQRAAGEAEDLAGVVAMAEQTVGTPVADGLLPGVAGDDFGLVFPKGNLAPRIHAIDCVVN
jgi:hypothetical protein